MSKIARKQEEKIVRKLRALGYDGERGPSVVMSRSEAPYAAWSDGPSVVRRTEWPSPVQGLRVAPVISLGKARRVREVVRIVCENVPLFDGTHPLPTNAPSPTHDTVAALLDVIDLLDRDGQFESADWPDGHLLVRVVDAWRAAGKPGLPEVADAACSEVAR